MERAVSRGSLITLGFAAFLAVFREGAETVLFYQALAAGADGQIGALIIGFIAASIALVGIYVLMRNASSKLPIAIASVC